MLFTQCLNGLLNLIKKTVRRADFVIVSNATDCSVLNRKGFLKMATFCFKVGLISSVCLERPIIFMRIAA
jgi:hypothetical protein